MPTEAKTVQMSTHENAAPANESVLDIMDSTGVRGRKMKPPSMSSAAITSKMSSLSMRCRANTHTPPAIKATTTAMFAPRMTSVFSASETPWMNSKNAMRTKRRCEGLTNELGFVVPSSSGERAESPFLRKGTPAAWPAHVIISSARPATTRHVTSENVCGIRQRMRAPMPSPKKAARTRSRLLPRAHREAPTRMRGHEQPKCATHTPTVATTALEESIPHHQTNEPTIIMATETALNTTGDTRRGALRATRATRA